MEVPGVWSCGNPLSQSSYLGMLTSIWVAHFEHQVANSVLHCNRWAQMHTHTQIHTDFLLGVSVYVSVLGLQGLVCLETRTDLLQDVKRVWCSSFSQSPTDLGTHTGRVQHTHKTSYAWLAWFAPPRENRHKMHSCGSLWLKTPSFTNTTHK